MDLPTLWAFVHEFRLQVSGEVARFSAPSQMRNALNDILGQEVAEKAGEG